MLLFNLNRLSSRFIEWAISYLKNYYLKIIDYIKSLEAKYNSKYTNNEVSGSKSARPNQAKASTPSILAKSSFYVKIFTSKKNLIAYDLKSNEKNFYFVFEALPLLNNFGIFQKQVIFEIVGRILNERLEFSNNKNISELIDTIFRIEAYSDQFWLNNVWIKEKRYFIPINKDDIQINFDDYKEFFEIYFGFISSLNCKICAMRNSDEKMEFKTSNVLLNFSKTYRSILDRFPQDCIQQFKKFIQVKTQRSNLSFLHSLLNSCNEIEATYENKVSNHSIYDDFSAESKLLVVSHYVFPLVNKIILESKKIEKEDICDLSYLLRFLIRNYPDVAKRIAVQPFLEGLDPSQLKNEEKAQKSEAGPESSNFIHNQYLRPLLGVIKADIMFKHLLKAKYRKKEESDMKPQTIDFGFNYEQFSMYLHKNRLILDLVVIGSFPRHDVFKGIFQLPINKNTLNLYMIEFTYFLFQINHGYIPLMFKLDSIKMSPQVRYALCYPKITENLYRMGSNLISAISDLLNYQKSNELTEVIFMSLLLLNEIVIFLQKARTNLLELQKNTTKLPGNQQFDQKITKTLRHFPITSVPTSMNPEWQKILLKLIFDMFYFNEMKNQTEFMKLNTEKWNSLRRKLRGVQNIAHMFYFYFTRNVQLNIELMFSARFLDREEVYIFLENNVSNSLSTPILILSRLVSDYDGCVDNLAIQLFWDMVGDINSAVSHLPKQLIGGDFQSCSIVDASWSDTTFVYTGFNQGVSSDENTHVAIKEEINLENLITGNLKERLIFEDNSLFSRQNYQLTDSEPILDQKHWQHALKLSTMDSYPKRHPGCFIN
ncbi:hypothetical protein RF11_02992 [Thelohanellus kitauei]|uniref:Uncharacterized protein n=1 Tax=Thelohanellus kitauei TaxID=669202 RepID=A0A0C2J8W4_THEKT|nr:hypothetical protein RF11_02992 [Thelohanellus kitauei]